MNKSRELSLPSSCLNKAQPDEPLFVLRANDPLAPQAVRLWAAMAVGQHEPGKIDEALHLAEEMTRWRDERQPGPAPTVAGSPIKRF